MSDALETRVRALRDALREMRRVMVCFSGGVDSSYLLAEAIGVLGEGAVAFTAVSPSLEPSEREAAQRLARGLGAEHVLVETHELDDARYAQNGPDRCYFCKREVYGVAVREARVRGIDSVVDGFNREDREDHRPGRRAAKQHGVRSPLDELGFDKAMIREAAKRIALPVWDKPALACLASRFPYGTPITPEALARVGRAERVLKNLGFRVVRVRHFGELARIEVGADELERFTDPALRERAEAGVRACGFERVEIDPRGYRRGALNPEPLRLR